MVRLVVGGRQLADATVVGHKFARQQSMRRAGYLVPEFFCVPAAAFDAAVAGILPPVTDDVVAWSAEARAAVLAAGVPAELGTALLTRFDALAGKDGLVAVRACTVADATGAGEDGADDPFAGLSDSFLYVDREGLLGAVAACWASAFNAEALLYRTHRGLAATSARVAVGVQRMVLGQRSFVAFTRDPRDGADRCVIAAAHGIGEGVVQEKADIDHFFVETAGAVRTETVHKVRMVGPADVVPAELADVPVLTDDEARAIAALARDVERHFGCPQDIEGTITADGAVHLVQARPATTPPATVPWTNHNVTESFPGVTSALTFSQAQEFYRTSFGDFYRRMGVPADTLRRNAHHLSHMIGSLRGHVYYRLDAWYALHGLVPSFELMRPTWERSLGLAEADRRPASRARGQRLRTLLAMPGLAARLLRHRGSVRRFLTWWDGFAADHADLERRSADELVAAYRRLWAEASVRWGVTLVVSFYGLAAVTLVTALLRRWIPGGEDLFIGLLCGGKENRSVAALRSALALAERFQADPTARAALMSTRDDQRLWREFDGELGAALRAHVDAYGDRALHDLKLEVATPRQEPWTVLAMLRPYVESGLTVAGNRADEERSRREAEDELRRRCPNPLRRAVLRTALAALRWQARAREDTRFCRSQLYGITRRIMWRLGELLADAGQLDSARDVTDLTVDEVIGAFDGTLPGGDLRGLVQHRRAATHDTAELPPFFATPAGVPVAAGIPEFAAREAIQAGGVLQGLASSRGTVRGRARVVLDPTVDAESCYGTVLIARETDPGWLYLMLGAKAMVVERGTLLSHTAITGRLLGIPTVVAVDAATTRIPDGAWVEVDGAAGTVRVLQDEAA
jgi:pyruvate,water dikinase